MKPMKRFHLYFDVFLIYLHLVLLKLIEIPVFRIFRQIIIFTIKLCQLVGLFLFVIFMNIDNRDLKQGETMFDYLKRKKRAALEKTLNRGTLNTSR